LALAGMTKNCQFGGKKGNGPQKGSGGGKLTKKQVNLGLEGAEKRRKTSRNKGLNCTRLETN